MGGKATSAKLILAEMAVSAVCSAFPILLSISPMTKCSNRSNEVDDGKPCRRKLEQSRCDASCYIDLCNYFLDAHRNLNLMLLGDDVSITLGTDLHRLRTFYLIVAS